MTEKSVSLWLSKLVCHWSIPISLYVLRTSAAIGYFNVVCETVLSETSLASAVARKPVTLPFCGCRTRLSLYSFAIPLFLPVTQSTHSTFNIQCTTIDRHRFLWHLFAPGRRCCAMRTWLLRNNCRRWSELAIAYKQHSLAQSGSMATTWHPIQPNIASDRCIAANQLSRYRY